MPDRLIRLRESEVEACEISATDKLPLPHEFARSLLNRPGLSMAEARALDVLPDAVAVVAFNTGSGANEAARSKLRALTEED